jgi:signal peptidase I
MASSGKKRRTGAGVVLFLLLICAILFYRNFHRVVVSGHSMEPTFHTGDKVFVSRAFWLVGPIRDGDVVVVKDDNPDGFIIKRVYKMGGEKVDWLNVPKSWSIRDGDYVVPDNKLFLLGDNRMASDDSRVFGPRDVSTVLGKVLYWPR